MAKTPLPTQDSFAAGLRALVTTPEVLRLINDITSCTVEWEPRPDPAVMEKGGLELFPCFTMYLQRHLLEVKGMIYPNLPQEEPRVSHLIRLELAYVPLSLPADPPVRPGIPPWPPPYPPVPGHLLAGTGAPVKRRD